MPHGANLHAVQKWSYVTSHFRPYTQAYAWKSVYQICVCSMPGTTFGLTVVNKRFEIKLNTHSRNMMNVEYG